MTNQSSVYTIGDYLSDLSEFLTPKGLRAICAKFKLEPTYSYSDVEQKDLDLLQAEMYAWLLSNAESLTPSVSDTDGDWTHAVGSITIAESTKRRWLTQYKKLRNKWNEPIEISTGFKILNL